jgi:hypothetical protein
MLNTSVADPDPNPDPSNPVCFWPHPDSDPLVRGIDPDPSIIKQNSKKNLDSYFFVTSS